MLQCKNPFPQTVTEACHLLSHRQNVYGNNNTKLTEANDSMAFTATGTEDNKGNTKKEITCYKCKKTGHYANECEEDDETMKTSNKRGLNFLVLNKDQDSSDDEANMTISHENLVAVQEDKKELDSYNDIAEKEGTITDDKEPESKDDYKGLAFLQDDILCSIQVKLAISRSWILLDS